MRLIQRLFSENDMDKNFDRMERVFMEKNVVELFAGVGGFRVGLNNVQEINEEGRAIERRAWNFVWANQWEPSTQVQHAFDCYVTRFGICDSHSNADISTVDKKMIPDHSLLVGGFPCQDYSVARTKSGEKGLEGKKGVLFWQIAEILKEKKSPFILLENVDRLLKSPAAQRGRDFGIMLRTFHDLDYNVEWRVINAADYGCAQRRRRVFIFAWKRTLKYNEDKSIKDAQSLILREGLFAKAFPIDCEEKYHLLRDIDLIEYEDTAVMTNSFVGGFENSGIMIDGIAKALKVVPKEQKARTLQEIREKRSGLNQYFLTEAQEKKFENLKGSKQIARKKPNGEDYTYSEGTMSYPDKLDLPGRTMLTSEATINRSSHVITDFETGKNRFITPIEAERMQSFPDDWTNTGMPERKRYFMMGNALVTEIINKLEPFLSDILEKEN